MANLQYIGGRYVPKFYLNPDDNSNDWKSGVLYEALTIVTYNNDSYTSKVTVPASVGNPADNPQYWACTTKYTAALVALQNSVGALSDRVDSVTYLNPDLYTGTDAQKLQACIDDAVAANYPTIIINREYDITGSILKINKGEYKSNTEFYRYRSKLTFVGVDTGCIVKRDSGYMFSADYRSGDIAFINVHFRGGVALESYMTQAQIISERENGCSVFDCSKLFRLTTINCSYTLLGIVFDGHEATSVAECIQTISSYGDVLTYSNAFMSCVYVWDVKIDSALIEKCNNAVLGYEGDSSLELSITSLKIVNSTIENIEKDWAIKFDKTLYFYAIVKNVVINNNYFESCINGCVYIDANNVQGAAIDYNLMNESGTGFETYNCIDIYNAQGEAITISHNTFFTGSYGIKCSGPQVSNLFVGNYVVQVGGVGSLTNSTSANTIGELKVYRSVKKTASTAGGATGTVVFDDFGGITDVKAIIVEGIGPDSTYNTHAEPLNVALGTKTLSFHTYGTDAQSYNVAYCVIGN